MKLAVVTTTFNRRFAEWKATAANTAVNFMGIGKHHVSCRPKNYIWQKEALINHAIKALDRYECIAWIDNDIIMPVGWYHKALALLKDHPVVQLFSHIEDTDEEGNVKTVLKAAAWKGSEGVLHRTPGGAVAIHRDILPEYGLYDRHPRADSLFMDACFGMHERELRKLPWAEYARPFCETISQHVNGNVGCLEGTARHQWHGDRMHKKEQVELLSRHNFEPEKDVTIGENGLLEWASDKPELHADMEAYLREDAKWQVA